MKTYLSICSGIEAASCAWREMGWQPVAFSEVEPFPCAVLNHHYPEIPNLGDMTKFKEWPDYAARPIDLLVGGTPCQSFSVAGLRRGLADPRGNLMLVFGAIAKRYRPTWLVWENVPGVLSSDEGRDFGTFLGMLAELGYGFAYRVLDAQYFGVAQRRRRVFVVGYLGDWRPAAAVLFERESLCRNTAPCRKKGQDVAGTIEAGLGRSRGSGTPVAGLTFMPHFEISPALKARDYKGVSNDGDGDGAILVPMLAGTLSSSGKAAGSATQQDAESGLLVAFSAKDYGADASIDLSPTLKAGTHDASHANSGNWMAVAFDTTQITSAANRSNPQPGGPCHPIAAGAHAPAVAFQPRIGRNGRGYSEEFVSALSGADAGATSDTRPCIASHMQVRRLTPVECERLQGFPDGYTDIRPKGKDTPDGPRYKALGNSMAVPVMRWIGCRIEIVNLQLMAESDRGNI